jgi:hypothetical protein
MTSHCPVRITFNFRNNKNLGLIKKKESDPLSYIVLGQKISVVKNKRLKRASCYSMKMVNSHNHFQRICCSLRENDSGALVAIALLFCLFIDLFYL